MIINNADKAQKYMDSISEKVINEVVEECLELLKKYIDEDVYEYDYFPNKNYFNKTKKPTYEFRDKAWVKSFTSVVSGRVQGALRHDYTKMVTRKGDSSSYMAHNPKYKESLAERLNVKGVFAHKERNEYWDNFIRDLDKNMDKWIIKHYKKYGIYLKLINKDWKIDI